MDLQALKKAIHDVAIQVRNGDLTKYDRLQELRKQHREACGVPEHAEPAAAPKEAPAEKPKRKSKKEEA